MIQQDDLSQGARADAPETYDPVQHTERPAAEAHGTQDGRPPKRKRRTGRKILLFVLLAAAGYAGYTAARVYLTPDRWVDQMNLVPSDAVIVVRSSEPVADWKRFSGSGQWQCLGRSRMFADIARRTALMDSVLNDNRNLLSLVGKRDILISLHKTGHDGWDFLIVLDLQRASKLDLLKGQMDNILRLAGNRVTQSVHNGIAVTAMHDAGSGDVLSVAFVDNHVVASYTTSLVTAAIDERNDPKIARDEAFLHTDRALGGNGLCRVFVNYANLPAFMALFLGNSGPVDDLSRSMDFAGLWFDVFADRLEVNGVTLMKEDASPYVRALFGSGRQQRKAHEILSARTAVYANISVDNTAGFFGRLEEILENGDRSLYDNYLTARKVIEKYFGVSIDDNLLGWMAGEFAFAQMEPGLLGQTPERIVAVRARSIKDARRNLDYLEKKMGDRSPLRFRNVSYKGYPVKYMEIRGLYRSLAKKYAQDFEALYYSYVGDYVVFSLNAATLLSFIEDYEQKNLLAGDAGFREVRRRTEGSSTVFAYVDMRKFFPQMAGLLNASARAGLEADTDVFLSFPHWAFQVVGGGRESSLKVLLDYASCEPGADIADGGPEPQEDPMTEKELMGELKRFYVEKFEGNVLREFYPGGQIRSESETRRGRRNGRYREYYEGGALRVRGRYSENRPKGVWKYYTEDGRFERKEKH